MSDVGMVRNKGEKREIQHTLDSLSNLENIEMKKRKIARERRYTKNIFVSCGSSQMHRNGTCLKCDVCGETTGCS